MGAESKVAYLVKKETKNSNKSLSNGKSIGKTTFNKPEERDIMRQCFTKINEQFPSNGVVIEFSVNMPCLGMHFPLLNKKELKEAIFWEMQEFSTIFSGDFISDYELINKEKDMYHVLLVAVPKEIIMDYAKIADSSGFPLKALDIYPLANARVLKEGKISDITAIIDLGSP